MSNLDRPDLIIAHTLVMHAPEAADELAGRCVSALEEAGYAITVAAPNTDVVKSERETYLEAMIEGLRTQLDAARKRRVASAVWPPPPVDPDRRAPE